MRFRALVNIWYLCGCPSGAVPVLWTHLTLQPDTKGLFSIYWHAQLDCSLLPPPTSNSASRSADIWSERTERQTTRLNFVHRATHDLTHTYKHKKGATEQLVGSLRCNRSSAPVELGCYEAVLGPPADTYC